MPETFPLMAVRGVDKTSAAFREQLVAGALAHGLNPSYIAAVIAFESGFNPQAMNPDGGALGLIQWRKSVFPASAKKAGMNVRWEDLPNLTAEEQLPLVFAYYADKPISDASHPSDYYLAVFLPIGVGKPQNFLLGKRDSASKHPGGLTLGKVYELNKGLDKNPSDGTITVAKAAAPVLSLLDAARGRAPILVPLVDGLPEAFRSTVPSPGGVYSSPLPRPARLPSGSTSEEADEDIDLRESPPIPLVSAPGSHDLPTLRRGSHGTLVCLLQRLLDVTSSSWDPDLIVTVDGEFGTETETALVLHQTWIRQRLGLPPSEWPADGVCGPKTWSSFWQPWVWSLDRMGTEIPPAGEKH